MYHLFLVAIALFFLSAHEAKAVPPPDFIFSVGTQIAQFFTVAFVLLSAAGSAIFQFFRQRFAGQKSWVFWSLFIVGAVAVSAGGAWLYGQYAQQQALEQWIVENKDYATSTTEVTIDEETGLVIADPSSEGDALDQLRIGGMATSTETASSTLSEDSVSQFIANYYHNIATGHLKDAYAASKKSVPYATFASWYASTTAITIDKLQRIDAQRSSLELTLTEGALITRYGVVIEVRLNNFGQPYQINRSEVRILGQWESDGKSFTEPTMVANSSTTPQPQGPEAITNDAFKQLMADHDTDFIVVDARENIEFENGHFPNATHIRFADLKAGRWIELPLDKPLIVFCWSGIRGKEVAEFLRSKNLRAQYIEKGADGWVKSGGEWQGDVFFLNVYTAEQYRKTFTNDESRELAKQGVVLVDTRSPAAFAKKNVPGSVNIPLMYTSTIGLDQAFSQVPSGSRVVTVCDGYVNCFDAKLTGVELERRGHTFLGRWPIDWKNY